MSPIKNFWVIIYILMGNQIIHSTQNNSADTLITRSFITPEMQFFIWKACMPDKKFTPNILTGKIPTINNKNNVVISDEIIINSKANYQIKKRSFACIFRSYKNCKVYSCS